MLALASENWLESEKQALQTTKYFLCTDGELLFLFGAEIFAKN